MPCLDQHRQRPACSKLRKWASITLSGICTVSKWKPCSSATVEHVQVDARVLVAGEADVADLARLLRLEQRLHGAAFGEDAVGIVEADDLVELHEVDAVGLRGA